MSVLKPTVAKTTEKFIRTLDKRFDRAAVVAVLGPKSCSLFQGGREHLGEEELGGDIFDAMRACFYAPHNMVSAVSLLEYATKCVSMHTANALAEAPQMAEQAEA
jgi:hypothetical protein